MGNTAEFDAISYAVFPAGVSFLGGNLFKFYYNRGFLVRASKLYVLVTCCKDFWYQWVHFNLKFSNSFVCNSLKKNAVRGDVGFTGFALRKTGLKLLPKFAERGRNRCGWNACDGDASFVRVPERSKFFIFFSRSAVDWVPTFLRVWYSREISCCPQALRGVGNSAHRGSNRFIEGANGVRVHPVLDRNVGVVILGQTLLRVTNICAFPKADRKGVKMFRRVRNRRCVLQRKEVHLWSREEAGIRTLRVNGVTDAVTAWICGKPWGEEFSAKRVRCDPLFCFPPDACAVSMDSRDYETDTQHYLGVVPAEQKALFALVNARILGYAHQQFCGRGAAKCVSCVVLMLLHSYYAMIKLPARWKVKYHFGSRDFWLTISALFFVDVFELVSTLRRQSAALAAGGQKKLVNAEALLCFLGPLWAVHSFQPALVAYGSTSGFVVNWGSMLYAREHSTR